MKMRIASILSLFLALLFTSMDSASFAADGPALIPKIEIQAARDTDLSLKILNYDDTYIWSAKSTAGDVIMDRIGNLSVINLQVGQKATITVTAKKDGFKTGVATYNGILGNTVEETIENSKPKPEKVTKLTKKSKVVKKVAKKQKAKK